ncbi:MAG: sensor histidine kinase [Candidatus Muiribacteriota bacterium]
MAEKKDFDEITLENISHHLKTPLSIIQGYCEIMLSGISGKLNNEQEEYLNKIKKEVYKTDNFLNNFLDRVEDGFKSNLIQKNKIDLKELLREIFMIFYSKAHETNVYPDFHLPDKTLKINVSGEFKKALILIVQEVQKIVSEYTKIIVELIIEKDNNYKILIYPEKKEFEKEIKKLMDNNIIFSTAVKIIKLENHFIYLENGRINIHG